MSCSRPSSRKRCSRNGRNGRTGLVALRPSSASPFVLAAAGFSIFLLSHSAAAQSSSSASKPPPSAATSAPAPPPPAPTTGELINGFAACMSSGEVNTPYCPHNAKNVESPIAGARYPLGSRLLMTWNSNWSTFAANSNVDLFLCPLDSSDQCKAMALRVPAKTETEERSLDASVFRPGNYFYVVVQSGDSPIVPFTMRGPTFAIVPAPTATSSSSTATSTVSVRIPDAASVTQNPPPAGTSAVPASSPESSPSLSTIAIICGIAGAALVAILGLVVLARRRRAQSNRKQAARASVLGTLPGAGSGKGESGSLAGTSDGGSGTSGDAAAAAPPASYNMLRRAGSMTKPPRVGPTPDEAHGNLQHTYVPAGGESPALMAASAPMTPIPGSAPLTASAAAASSPGRLAATPVAGAISSTEAILIANSFKLALKKSIDDDDDEDISTMINSLGMRPIPDASGQATAAGAAGLMSPQQSAAAVLLDTPVPPTVTSPPGLVPRSVYPATSTASTATVAGDAAASGADIASLKSASPVPPAPASLVSLHAHSTSPHIPSPLALGHAGGRQASHDDQHSLLTGSMPRSIDSASLPRSISESTAAGAGHMTVERVSLDHRDRESTLLGRAPVKQVGSPYTAVVVVDPQDDEAAAGGAQPAAPVPPTVMVSLPRSESGSMPRVSIVPELDEGSSGEDASSAKSLVMDPTGPAAAGKR